MSIEQNQRQSLDDESKKMINRIYQMEVLYGCTGTESE